MIVRYGKELNHGGMRNTVDGVLKVYARIAYGKGGLEIEIL
jgi:hypothetical protein